MRFGRWFKSFKQIRFWQIWQWKSVKTRRWDHLRENQSALLKINESFKAKTIRIDSFTILLNFQKRRQKTCRRYGRRIQIERPVQWWVIVTDFYQLIVNPCGESDQLIVHFNFAKNGWAKRSFGSKIKIQIFWREASLRVFSFASLSLF